MLIPDVTWRASLLAFVLLVLTACASRPDSMAVPTPLAPRVEGSKDSTSGEAVPSTAAAEANALEVSPTPPPPGAQQIVSDGQESAPAPRLVGAPIVATYDSLPLPAFINQAFSGQLGLSFQIAPEIATLPDLVSVKVTSPLSRNDFYAMAVRVLTEYGVASEWDGDVVKFSRAPAGATVSPPLIVSGRALPQVPVSHRPIFQMVPLESVRTNDVISWLKGALKVEGLEVLPDERRNAIVLSGRPAAVRQGIEAIRVLDRPSLRGRYSAQIEPAFLPAGELAPLISAALTAQGFATAVGSDGLAHAIILMPVPATNTILVFAAREDLLAHTVDWARKLDRPARNMQAEAVFYYQVKNTRANDIASILTGTQGGNRSGARTSQPTAATAAPQPATPANRPAQQSATAGGQLVVDEPRNALIFRGAPTEWERLLTLVRQMDKPARQVMVEVTIAEVTLDDNEQFGVGWFAKGGYGRFGSTWQLGAVAADATDDETVGNSGGNGLRWLLDVAGDNRALLTAFAQDQRVSILSTPRLLVKSGEEASIDVGTEVPIITSQTTSSQVSEGSSNLLQSIQYRRTGILLNVKPTVYSNDRIDLELSQEVSESLPAGDGASIPSPSIFNRSISTNLTLRDGGSVVIGGLMSTRESLTKGGVPGLKDLPLIGNLFRNRNSTNNKTELVLLIVPYIIETDSDASALTRAIGDQLELLDLRSETVLPSESEQAD